MGVQNNVEILKKHFIFCEGVDARYFLTHFFDNLSARGDQRFKEAFQIESFGGNDSMRSNLRMLSQLRNFDDLKSLLIVRDAEDDFRSAFDTIRGAIKNVNTECGKDLPIPHSPRLWAKGDISVGFLIFPSCNSEPLTGTLEHLCLSILKEDKANVIMQEIEAFIGHLRDNHGRKFPRMHKTKLHTYFSVTNTFVTLKIGEAARAGAFDWEHEKMRSISDFLSEVL